MHPIESTASFLESAHNSKLEKKERMKCKGSLQFPLLLLSLAPASVLSFSPQSHQLTGKSFLRKSVVVSDISDEWWLDDYPNDKDSSSWDGKDVDLSSSKSHSSQFLQGEQLKQLRSDLEAYRENLKWAIVMNDEARVLSLTKEIEEQESKDPELVYNKAKKLIAEAESASRSVLKPDLKEKLIKHWSEQREKAKECLPRFHMEG